MRFFSTIKNIYKIPELRKRIITTISLLIIFRLGSFIVLPGINPEKVTKSSIGIFNLLDNFLGGAFSNASIFALGIMPYISASIAVQLLTFALPYFQKLQKDGQSGQNKLNNITRTFTIFITLFQSFAYLSATISHEMLWISRGLFTFTSLIILLSGTMFCMWLGERITEKGIGNGISMLIMVGIISSLPGACFIEVSSKGLDRALFLLLEFTALFFIIIGFIFFTEASRRIPIQYAKQIAGSTTANIQTKYIPFKLNTAGVMPIIFAQALIFIPGLVLGFLPSSPRLQKIIQSLADFTTWQYNLLFSILIISFTFFYTAITINPNQIADDMKRSGGFIPGVKPGKDTENYIDNVLSKITLPSAIILAIIAIIPALAYILGVSREFSQFFGGTSLLIVVGVFLEIVQQTKSYLLMHYYDGLMKIK